MKKMDSPRTGSSELVYIHTDKVDITIKGKPTHSHFYVLQKDDGESVFKVFCSEQFELSLNEIPQTGVPAHNSKTYSGIYSTVPLFFEQQRYEIIIESSEGHTVSFWHENYNIRNRISKSSRNHEILSGVINFNNEIGLSDLIIMIDGQNYLRMVIEVFPSKINYKEDYQKIIADVTQEIYSIVFEFLKKTYTGYQQSERVSSNPVEFFAVIKKIYSDFIKAADIILAKPHHLLVTTHEVLPSHKIKRTDNKTLRWIERHPDQARIWAGSVAVAQALAVKKKVTYDTKENRLTKYILESTAKKLTGFRHGYLNLKREEDQSVITKIDSMIEGLNRRSNLSFLMDVSAHESAAGMSLVFTMAPGYRDLYKYYLMLLRGLSITGDIFQMSVKDLAVLYEYWCFIKLNSIMKERYEMVSQDIIKMQGNGLFVSLVKGKNSRVKYRNSHNGETITLSYNPKSIDVPTVSQRPDNVLMLEKKRR
jgi:predicted component of viral defense system (DUF524 family)